VPDPQDEETARRSVISHHEADPFYRELLQLRRTLPRRLDVETHGSVLTMRRGDRTLVADFDAKTVELR
jgi:hypothetical protein